MQGIMRKFDKQLNYICSIKLEIQLNVPYSSIWICLTCSYSLQCLPYSIPWVTPLPFHCSPMYFILYSLPLSRYCTSSPSCISIFSLEIFHLSWKIFSRLMHSLTRSLNWKYMFMHSDSFNFSISPRKLIFMVLFIM